MSAIQMQRKGKGATKNTISIGQSDSQTNFKKKQEFADNQRMHKTSEQTKTREREREAYGIWEQTKKKTTKSRVRQNECPNRVNMILKQTNKQTNNISFLDRKKACHMNVSPIHDQHQHRCIDVL
jgi:hypothetical protein